MTINNGREDAVAEIMELTNGLGADVAIEAVGVPATFELCTEIVRPGGTSRTSACTASPVTLHLEKLWIKGVTITTGLVDTFTTPTLLKLIASGRLDANAVHDAPVQAGRGDRGLRRLRRSCRDERPQGRPRR